jgi:hypothetical protein
MTDPSGTDSAQPPAGDPQDSQQIDSEDSEPGDLVDLYDDEKLKSQSAARKAPRLRLFTYKMEP